MAEEEGSFEFVYLGRRKKPLKELFYEPTLKNNLIQPTFFSQFSTDNWKKLPKQK
jgi:hypothetical protein